MGTLTIRTFGTTRTYAINGPLASAVAILLAVIFAGTAIVASVWVIVCAIVDVIGCTLLYVTDKIANLIDVIVDLPLRIRAYRYARRMGWL